MPNANNVLWPTPLTRLTPFYPGQFGVPGTDSDRGLRQDSNGKILWVDPNHVDNDDRRDGTDPTCPLTTVAAALARCRAYSNDVVAVAPNSFWTYGSVLVGRATPIAETVVVTTPGVRIVGLSSGTQGVNWIATANSACITIRAMDVVVEGFNFWNSGAVVGSTGILAQWNSPLYFGENFTVRNCNFYHLAYGIQADYTWYCNILSNYFDGMTTAAIHNPSVFGEPDYMTIVGNFFTGNASAINLPDVSDCDIQHNKFSDNNLAITMEGADNNIVHANVINEDPTGTDNYINLDNGSGNMVSDNWLGCTIAQYDVTCDDAGSGQWVRNHCIDGETAAAPV